jgi:hypothetical protein
VTEPRSAGIQPWFPWPLSRWDWLTEQIPAERLAAVRIAAAVVLLIDIGISFLPHFGTFFSPEFAALRLYDGRFRDDHAYWSVLRLLPAGWGTKAVFGVWIASAVALLVGWRPLVSGLVAWACAVSVWNYAPGLANGGDRLRHVVLVTVAVGCTGAVWGVSSVRSRTDPRPVLVPGWPIKVLFVQLAALYFFSGYYKVLSPIWRNGYVMYWASNDLVWSLVAGSADLVPVWVHRLSAVVALIWELGFPVLAVVRITRVPTLILGVLFHLGTLFTLEVGPFALYSIVCYAGFVPWERWRGDRPA